MCVNKSGCFFHCSLSLTRKHLLCPSRDSQRRLSTAEQGQANAEGELELERERVRQLLAEVERLKGEVERTRSAGPVTPDGSRIAELEALLSQARADVGKFQALAEKNASAYQNAMARLFPALSLLSARCVSSVVSRYFSFILSARGVVVQSFLQQ